MVSVVGIEKLLVLSNFPAGLLSAILLAARGHHVQVHTLRHVCDGFQQVKWVLVNDDHKLLLLAALSNALPSLDCFAIS